MFQFRNFKIVYRRYAGLYFCFCVDVHDNNLYYLEAIHNFVEVRKSRNVWGLIIPNILNFSGWKFEYILFWKWQSLVVVLMLSFKIKISLKWIQPGLILHFPYLQSTKQLAWIHFKPDFWPTTFLSVKVV